MHTLLRVFGRSPRRVPWAFAATALLLACALAGVAARAQEQAADAQAAGSAAPAAAPSAGPEEATAGDPSKPMGPADEYNRGTPRGSMYGFLTAARAGDYERAANFLDLRQLPAGEQDQGPRLARELQAVLDRTLWVDFQELSDSNAGHTDDGLPAWQDLLGRIETSHGPKDLLLQRVPRKGDGVRIWKVAASTVAAVPALYEEFGPGPIAQFLPRALLDLRALDLALWQWIGLLVLVPLAWGLARLLSWLSIRLVRPFVSRTESTMDDRVVALLEGPLRLALGVAFFALGTLPLSLTLAARDWLRGAEKALLIVAATWALLRMVDLAALVARERMLRTRQPGAIAFLAPGQKTVKVLLVMLAGIAMLSNLGFNVTALLAGFGVGGIAVALAAQKTVENLFGGVTLYTDQPIRVGDFCRFGSQIGTVEEIGLRSTRVRTLDRTIVTIPNAEFSALQIENFARRDRIRLTTTLGLRYETTPEQLRYVLARLRELLLAHPKIDEDPARVRFVGFGAYSLDLEVFAYARTADWNEFLQIREDVYLRMMDVVAESGTGFAFPSQTTYVGRDDGLDEKAAREAEARVAAWREGGRLPFPMFDSERTQELRDTLDWPPEGSPAAVPRAGPRRHGADE